MSIGIREERGIHQRAKSQTRAHSRIKDRSYNMSNEKINLVEPFVGEYVNKYGNPGSFVPSSTP